MRFKDYDIDEFIERIDREMAEFKKLMKENPEEAKRVALRDLMNSGIIDENGNLKPPYNGEKVNPTDFTRGPKAYYEQSDLYYIRVAQNLNPAERSEIWHKVSRSCETCTNQSCRIDTREKVGLDEFGKPQGSSCIGWKNDRIIGEYKVLKLTK